MRPARRPGMNRVIRVAFAVSAGAGCSGSPSEPTHDALVMQADRLAGTTEMSCALDRSREVVCWGFDGPARVSPGDGSLRFTPVSTSERFVDIVAGSYH